MTSNELIERLTKIRKELNKLCIDYGSPLLNGQPEVSSLLTRAALAVSLAELDIKDYAKVKADVKPKTTEKIVAEIRAIMAEHKED